jgi:prophage antirepressor-like protein
MIPEKIYTEDDIFTSNLGGVAVRLLLLSKEEIGCVAPDLIHALYPKTQKFASVTDYLKTVPDCWKAVGKIHGLGGPQNTIILSEPGMWFRIIRSNSPLAFPFQKTLAEDVLPAIRKYGRYELKFKSLMALETRHRIDRAKEKLNAHIDSLHTGNELRPDMLCFASLSKGACEGVWGMPPSATRSHMGIGSGFQGEWWHYLDDPSAEIYIQALEVLTRELQSLTELDRQARDILERWKLRKSVEVSPVGRCPIKRVGKAPFFQGFEGVSA